MNEIVECRSDYTYAQQPVALTWQGQRYEVIRIVERWRSPAALHFKVLSHDDRVFMLVYNEAEDHWSIETDEIPKNISNTHPLQTDKERT